MEGQTDAEMTGKRDLADEDVSGSAERLGRRSVEAESEEASQHSDDSLHDAKVVQHGDERTEVHDHREGLRVSEVITTTMNNITGKACKRQW